MKERIMREPEVVEEGFRALESERESEYGRIYLGAIAKETLLY